jgi:hypothetical protein
LELVLKQCPEEKWSDQIKAALKVGDVWVKKLTAGAPSSELKKTRNTSGKATSGEGSILDGMAQDDDEFVVPSDDDNSPSRGRGRGRKDSVIAVNPSSVSAWAVNFVEETELNCWLSDHKDMEFPDVEADKAELVGIAVRHAEDGKLLNFADAMNYQGHQPWEEVAADQNIDIEASRRQFPPSPSPTPDPIDVDMDNVNVASQPDKDSGKGKKAKQLKTNKTDKDSAPRQPRARTAAARPKGITKPAVKKRAPKRKKDTDTSGSSKTAGPTTAKGSKSAAVVPDSTANTALAVPAPVANTEQASSTSEPTTMQGAASSGENAT